MGRTQDAELDAELAAVLRERGQRVTLPRLLVNRHVRRVHRHITAEQVHTELAAELPSLSPATIYATLDLLDELGLVRRMSTPGGATLYDSRVDEHHHAICRSCASIVDLEATVATAGAVAAAGRSGFVVEHAEVQLFGLCARCAG